MRNSNGERPAEGNERIKVVRRIRIEPIIVSYGGERRLTAALGLGIDGNEITSTPTLSRADVTTAPLRQLPTTGFCVTADTD